ncbi:MAG: hypothetical protein WAN05_29590 [Roseiarcus sp.]
MARFARAQRIAAGEIDPGASGNRSTPRADHAILIFGLTAAARRTSSRYA